MLVSATAIFAVSALSVALLLAVALKLIFAPDSAQGKAAASRIRGLHEASGHNKAAALVRSQARKSAGRVWPIVGDLTLLVQRAGMEGKETVLALGTLGFGGLLGMVLMALLGGPIGLFIGFGIAGLSAYHILKMRHQKRADAITKQLPDALDLITRGLRVGHPVNTTIANVARTMPDPIGAEFRNLGEQISHGHYLTEAFNDFAHRIGQEDVEYLAVAINIQHGTGGNLAEILGTLSKVIRDRMMMRRRVRAISSEGRVSAYILSALPVVIYFATSMSAPDYYSAVSDDPMFRPIAMTIAALVIGNFLALRKLVAFQF